MGLALCATFGGSLVSLHALPIQVNMTTTNGVVPGTGIGYTVSSTGSARNVFASASSDNAVWSWTGGFPEFVAAGAQTLTVTFDNPVALNRFVFGIVSTWNSTSQLNLVGGNATFADFNVFDTLQVYTGMTGAATYNPATGVVTSGGQDRSLMIGSDSTNTVTGFSFAAGPSLGGSDGYTVFVGFTDAAEVPEPATAMMLLAGLGLLCGRQLHLRSKSL